MRTAAGNRKLLREHEAKFNRSETGRKLRTKLWEQEFAKADKASQARRPVTPETAKERTR